MFVKLPTFEDGAPLEWLARVQFCFLYAKIRLTKWLKLVLIGMEGNDVCWFQY